MKLINVKILGDSFRSLASNKLYEFNHDVRENRLSTKVFAGLNGSGKSNFLELFSEIFYFLEIYHLDTVSESEKSSKAFGFEIEYLLPKTIIEITPIFEMELQFAVEDYIKNNLPLTKLSRKVFEKRFSKQISEVKDITLKKETTNLIKANYIHIRIAKQLGETPQFSIIRKGEITEQRIIEYRTNELLPKKIIAYTSGQNELLSNPYYKLKYHYFKSFGSKQTHKETLTDNHRLFFLDYSTNFSIFIANVLLANKQKVDILKDALQIVDLQSFRITLNTNQLYKNIRLSKQLANNIERLKLCATTWIEKKVDSHNLLILDYIINKDTKLAFEYHFHNAFNLFSLFYELEIFNLYLIEKKARDLMLRVHKSYNFSDEMSKPEPSRLIFRIEKIHISKQIESTKPPKNIYYKALSDGEHQFNEIVGTILMMEEEGCLFLIDEPDTHFNPRWRAKLIKMLNYMAATAFDRRGNIKSVRKQEVILTTHSPFVISDSLTEDVYRFTKKNGVIEFSNPSIITYGASISIVMEEIFEKEDTISEMAKKELRDMVENIKSLEDLRGVVDRLNNEFGDSVEKFDLYSKLRVIKEEIELKK